MNRKSVWDFWARYYDRLWVQRFFLAPTRKRVLELMEKYMDESASDVLDIGCGIGQLARDIQEHFVEKNLRITGIDFSGEMIERAEKESSGIQFFEMDAANLLELGGEYDVMVCTHSFPYYRNQKQAIADMTTKLKDGGILILAHASANTIYDRLIHSIVKVTAGGGKYPSIADVIQMRDERLKILEMEKLYQSQVMTTILFTVFKKRGNDEDTID